jgi:hypothetical protein
MRRRIIGGLMSALLFAGVSVITVATAAPAGAGGFSRQISSGGTTSFHGTSTGADNGVQWPEFAGQGDSDAGPAAFDGQITDRSQTSGHGNGVSSQSGKKAKSNPELVTSFDALNHRQQRLANGGNQFSLEPPDQGLCAGNGFVMETINDVMRVFDTSGNAQTGVVDLNTFYGYPAQFNRTTGAQGPFVTDPSCYFDQQTQRWFADVLTLEVNPVSGHFLGPNHLDLAVSRTSDPTGSWNIYRLPVQDDGTDGTPNHHCSSGPDSRFATNPNACIGDYPHLGADANGIYLTTNEYSLFGPEFVGAQVYAFSKAALVAGSAMVTVTQFDTHNADPNGNPGFTVWPATSPGTGSFATGNGGTEFFMSSDAADEANGTHVSNDLLVWTMTNTSSLNTSSPALSLGVKLLNSETYAVPPSSDQKAGSFPLGQCLNDTPCSTFLIGGPDPFAPEPEYRLDSNDSRMQQVTYANGKLWGALDTALTLNNVNKAGVAWFIVNPNGSKIVNQGYLGLANNNLTYPAIGVTASGRGAMAFTVVGSDYYPSAGYAPIDALSGVGDIHVAAAGLGPADGFSGYRVFANPPSFNARPRWGDYGYTAIDGNKIWIASEYINQTCTLAQYEATPFGSCGGTRSSLANWGTRISELST